MVQSTVNSTLLRDMQLHDESGPKYENLIIRSIIILSGYNQIFLYSIYDSLCQSFNIIELCIPLEQHFDHSDIAF